ncbi:MAG: hypothetical protein ACTSUP_06305 [Candidatus Heimdallarchaeaceae archaeon]
MNLLRKLKKYSIHFGIYFLITFSIIAVSVLIHELGPQPLRYSDDSWNDVTAYTPTTNLSFSVIFDQHSHTKLVGGILTVEQNILWHITMGFNACVITDHNTMKNSEDIAVMTLKYQGEFVVIQGMEYTNARIHMNFIGITSWDFRVPLDPSDEEIQEAIDEVHLQGGVVTANHYVETESDGKENFPSLEQLILWGVDFIEIVNDDVYDEASYEFCLENNGSIGMITGTDMHRPHDVFAWTGINAENFTKEGIMAELLNHNTSIIYDSTGVDELGRSSSNPWNVLLRPFYDFGDVLSDYHIGSGVLDSVGLVVFFSYYFAIFILIEVSIFMIKKNNEKKKENEKSE